MKQFSPLTKNKFVTILIERLKVKKDPILIPLRPETYSRPLYCFVNVDEKVKRNGGRRHFGWIVIQDEITCQAIRHAVWEGPDVKLLDITPFDFSQDSVMFLSDDKDFDYHGQLVGNIRVNVTDKIAADHYIKANEIVDVLQATGTRLFESMIYTSDTQIKIDQYTKLIHSLRDFIISNKSESNSCICLNSLPYMQCHGKLMMENMNIDMREIQNENPKKE